MSLDALTASAAPAHADVVAAIHSASVKTGSDFDYLLGTAMRESGLNSQAKSKGSSATGLYQFIDQTWLGLVKRYGDRHGLAQYASAIKDGGNGHYAVDSEEAKAAILALRKNPELSALMAGESALAIKENLEGVLGRKVCGGELYAAHFLGADAACKLIRTSQSAPSANAAQLFPQAAGANRSVFFHADGTAKSVREVYDWAMQQPGSAAPLADAAPADASPATARIVAARAVDTNIESLLAGVMNWQPGSFFGSEGASPLSFGSGLLDLFSSARNGL